MTHHPSYTHPQHDLDESDVLHESAAMRDSYVDELHQQIALGVDRLARALNVTRLEVLQSMIEDEHDARLADLVEVAPGVTLPSAEAERYFERKALEADCKRCQLEHETSFVDADEYDVIEPVVLSTPHSCHIERYELIERDALTAQYVRGLLTLDEYAELRRAGVVVETRYDDELMAFVESRCELSSKIAALPRVTADEHERALTAYETGRELVGQRVVVKTIDGPTVRGTLRSCDEYGVAVVTARNLRTISGRSITSIKRTVERAPKAAQ